MKKVLRLITKLITALFFTVLVCFILNQNQIFQINLLNISYLQLFILTIITACFNIAHFAVDNKIKVKTLSSEFSSLIKHIVQAVSNFINFLSQNFSRFYQKSWVKFGLIPLVLLIFGIALSLYNILTTDDPISVLSINHGSKVLKQTETTISGEFKAMEDNLGIVAIEFKTGEETIDDQVLFKIKEKGSPEWYYENTYNLEQIQDGYVFPIGFPPIEDSKNKVYYFEINDKTPNLKSGLLISKYKFSKDSLIRKGEIINITTTKLINYIQKHPYNLVLVLFTSMIPLLAYIAFLYIPWENYIYVLFIISVLIFINDVFLKNRQIFSSFLYLIFIFFFFYALVKSPSKSKLEKFNRISIKASSVKFLFIFLIIAGFLIRLPNLEKLPPYPDEYAHLITARDLVKEFNLKDIYTRSFIPVTFPAYLSFKILGSGLFQARLIMAIFNVIAVIPLFHIVKKINKQTALFVSFIYLFNPWNIAVSRTVREYAVLPLIFSFIVLIFFKIWEEIPHDFKITEIFNLQFLKIIWPNLLIIIGTALYSFFIDPQSSVFKLIFLIYFSFLIFLLLKFDFSSKINKIFLALIFPILIFLGYMFISQQTFVGLKPELNFKFWNKFFFHGPIQQIYYGKNNLVILLPLGLFIYALLKKKIHKNIFFYILNFLINYLFLGALFTRYFRPRYGFSLQYWFLILFGISISIFYYYLVDVSQKKFLSLLTILLFLVNPLALQKSINLHKYNEGGYVPITSEYHLDIDPVFKAMEEQLKSSDYILIDGTNILEWHRPELYSNSNVIQFVCNDENHETKDRYLLPNSTKASFNSKNITIISTWRSNRGNCIEQRDDLTNFQLIEEINGVYIYSNFNLNDNSATL